MAMVYSVHEILNEIKRTKKGTMLWKMCGSEMGVLNSCLQY